jgi:ribosomal protein S18 acetylase RimI-like enzyme
LRNAPEDLRTIPGVVIELVSEPAEEVLEALTRLVPQLSTSAKRFDAEQLQMMLDSDAVRLLVAKDEVGRIVGALTLAIFPIPTGVRAWIEDVIVDQDARGQGIGEALTVHALELARAAGARTVDLTSRPLRVAANRLYDRIGFSTRDTNVYRFEL